MIENRQIIFYFYHLNVIGGIETFFWQLVRKYHDRDIVIYYQTGSIEQANRLREYVNVEQYHGQIIHCQQAFFNFNLDIINNVKAKEYIQVLHGDYKDMIQRGQLTSVPTHPKITRYIGVSKLVCDSFTEITGLPCELSYNPYQKYECDKPLMLISATRLSAEKGYDRMKNLILELDKRNINYLWFIFTNSPKEHISNNVIYLSPRLDIEKYIGGFDYFIQLSDNEGYCYSVIEALSHNVPVIVTPLPVLKELNVNETNSISFNFDSSNLDDVIDEMLHKKFNFNYSTPNDNYDKIFIKCKGTYYEDKHKKAKVKATSWWTDNHIQDAELKYIPYEGEEWITSYLRAIDLENDGCVKLMEVINENIEHNNSSI